MHPGLAIRASASEPTTALRPMMPAGSTPAQPPLQPQRLRPRARLGRPSGPEHGQCLVPLPVPGRMPKLEEPGGPDLLDGLPGHRPKRTESGDRRRRRAIPGSHVSYTQLSGRPAPLATVGRGSRWHYPAAHSGLPSDALVDCSVAPTGQSL
jgi:hypothetical protein